MDANEMQKTELEQWSVSLGVANWGEAERIGLAKQAAKKTLGTLRYEYDSAAVADGKMTAAEMMARATTRESGPTRYQAAHCNADGPT